MTDEKPPLISFKDLRLDEVVLALYRGTRPVGLGFIHNKNDLSIDDVRKELADRMETRPKLLHIDYFFGRPLKVSLHLDDEVFDPRLYDRDAGSGAAACAIENLRASKST